MTGQKMTGRFRPPIAVNPEDRRRVGHLSKRFIREPGTILTNNILFVNRKKTETALKLIKGDTCFPVVFIHHH